MHRRTLVRLVIPIITLFAVGCSGPGRDANTGSPQRDRPVLNLNGALATPIGTPSAHSRDAEQYDLAFIDSMTYHHQAAVQMADLILEKTRRSELKAFAAKLKDDQSKEIDELKQWRDAWYPGEPSALDMGMPGTDDEGMQIFQGAHLKEMDEMEPAHLDNHFLNMLIGHHRGGNDLAKEGLVKASHDELKQFAQRLLKRQDAELDQLRHWRSTWKK